MASSDPTEESLDGETPAGGVRSTVYYLDDEGKSCPKSKATRAEAIEFDADGNAIQRTLLVLDRPKGDRRGNR